VTLGAGTGQRSKRCAERDREQHGDEKQGDSVHVRIQEGTAHSLHGRHFPIPVMGKTGTTSDFRDALFVGSTYGPQGITVAVTDRL